GMLPASGCDIQCMSHEDEERAVAAPALSAAKLIARYIEPNPHRPGADEVRIRGTGIPVWALIGQFEATGLDRERTAASYRLPVEALDAALAYYSRHREVIRARIAANAA